MTSVEIVKMVMSNAQVSLSRDSIHALADVLVPKKYKKGECVLNEGEVCDCLRVIEKGMLRQYYFKYDKELTEHIAYEWGTVVCLQSYIEEKPTTLLIETLEPTICGNSLRRNWSVYRWNMRISVFCIVVSLKCRLSIRR